MSKVDLSPYEPKVPRLRPRDWRWSILLGFVVSNVTGVAAMGLIVLLMTGDWDKLGDVGNWTKGTILLSNIFIIPFGMGVVASYFWRDVPDKIWRQTGCGLLLVNYCITVAGAYIVLREGTLCLLMASPLLGTFMALGTVFGHSMWKKNKFFSVSLLPLFAVFITSDAIAPHQFVSTATTDFHSSAPPQALWKYTAQYPAIPYPADWWMWKLGMPMPSKAVGEPKAGARRDCTMSNGIRVGGAVTGVEANRRLDFTIDVQPNDPEAMEHFILRKGSIHLIPDGKGGTIIRGVTTYELKVFPANYFNWYAEGVVHNLHRRVFTWMDELAREDMAKAKRKS